MTSTPETPQGNSSAVTPEFELTPEAALNNLVQLRTAADVRAEKMDELIRLKREAAESKERLSLIEDRVLLEGATLPETGELVIVDGKNAEQRKAQLEVICDTLPDYAAARRTWRDAEASAMTVDAEVDRLGIVISALRRELDLRIALTNKSNTEHEGALR